MLRASRDCLAAPSHLKAMSSYGGPAVKRSMQVELSALSGSRSILYSGACSSKQYNRDTGLSIWAFLHCFLFGSCAPWWRLWSEKRPSCVPAFVRHQNRKLLYASKA